MIKISFSKQKPAIKGMSFLTLNEEEDSSVLLRPSGEKEIILGLGPKKKFNRRKLILAARKIITLGKSNKIKKIALNLKDFLLLSLKIPAKEMMRILAENFEMANFEFVKYKTIPKTGWHPVEEIVFYGTVSKAIKEGAGIGQVIGKEINHCRELANMPGGEITPKKLAEAAVGVAEGTKIEVEILSKNEIEKMKMGGILGVAKGSKEEPQFITMEYTRGKGKPIVLIGKGVTFDTGGLNIKTGDYMNEMHMDMSGGAAVIHSIVAAAKLGLKKNIVGLIPAVENMPSGESYRPGDILKSLCGKTIEVINTDAEGRIIVADAISYAKKYNPALVVDVATLTSAAIVALGQHASALFTKDRDLAERFVEWGEESGDYLWPLPLWEEYEEEVKGTFGDVANASKSRYGGAINGATFLYQFAKDLKCPWIHIDIAPRMTVVDGEYLAKGAAGAPVRFLIRLLERY